MGIITLTTDFGTDDHYVAAMKGVILSIHPQATIVDISHAIPPQDIMAGAFMLANAAPYFPPGTVHVAVIDPGVGSERRPIALRVPRSLSVDPTGTVPYHYFVGPDNGVLTLAVGLWFGSAGPLPPLVGPSHLQITASAVNLTNRKFWLPGVSHTFHGRDIFAPVAAHLSRAAISAKVFAELGEALSAPAVQMNIPPVSELGNMLTGSIIHIDRFGNCISNVLEWRIADRREASRISAGGRTIQGIRRTYAEVERGDLLALIGSSGYLEIAVRDGSAAGALGLRVGDALRIDMG
jgi:S-adenosyl-L-methionine hydrolase (adenosine-forming)